MNISQAARATGLSSKAIRYYDELGLVVPGRDLNNDYRTYTQSNIEQLRFLQRARAVGFSLDACRELLGLYADPQRRSEQVKALVVEKIAQVDQQLEALVAMKNTLLEMANECAGDTTSDCAILNQLAVPVPAPGMAFRVLDER